MTKEAEAVEALRREVWKLDSPGLNLPPTNKCRGCGRRTYDDTDSCSVCGAGMERG